MDRLTKPGHKFNLINVLQGLSRYADVDEILNRLSAYEDTGLEPEEINHIVDVTKMISVDRLREICEAEKDGRVVVPPCKVEALKDKYGELTKPTGDEAETYTTGYRSGHKNGQAELIAYLLQITTGTQEEAEQALKERRN